MRHRELLGALLPVTPFFERIVGRNGPLDPLREQLQDRLFRHLEIDAAWQAAAHRGAARGPVVYVLRHAAILDFVALDHLTRKLGLPRVGFVNGLPPAVTPQPRRHDNPTALRHALSQGSAALFLKRRAAAGELRAKTESSELFEALISAQRTLGQGEIVMLPTLFVWTRNPERRGFSMVDSLLGPVDSPTELRRAGQFALNFKSCELRAGDPLSLVEFLRHEEADDATLARRLSYSLLRKVERERRTIVGPAQKAPDRVREEVLRSPKLRRVIADLAGPRPEDRAKLTERARQMLREMQTIVEPQTQAGMALVAEQLLERVYAGIDVDEAGIERLRELHARGSVVLLPSHKSHVDYIVLSYVLKQRSIQTPVIAAGDNLAFFPAGPVLRRCGAFYIRRSFRGDRLYTAVLDAYVRRLMRDGWMIEFFLEGTRSRTGKPLLPMLGLLNMVVSAALGIESRKMFFVPVSIGYERSVEESSFSRELSGGKKQKEDAGQLLKAGGVLTDRWGRINIQLGEPIDLDELRAALGLTERPFSPAKRRGLVKRLGHQVMSEINRVTAITPGALVSLVLLSVRKGISYADLLRHAELISSLMLDLGARATPSIVSGGRLRELGVRETLHIYLKSGLIEQHVPGDTLTSEQKRRKTLHTGPDVIFTVPDNRRLRLDFTKNHIVHWIVDRGLVAVALRCDPGSGLHLSTIAERVQSLSRMFKYEFMFRADGPPELIFSELVADMSARGEIVCEGDEIRPGAGREGLDGSAWLGLYASALRNFFESYLVAIRGLTALLRVPLERKELVARTLRLGERMFLQGEIERSEAVSQPMLENAFSSFVDQGYLTRSDGKLAIAASFASTAGLAAIEGRVSAYLS